ncbi:MAG TPA: hypothetical protein VGE74_24610 [Gemmata sp.]
MTATEPVREDNPRWLAVLLTALPVALAALLVFGLYPPAGPRAPGPHPAPAAAGAPATDPNPLTTVARAP